MTQLERELKSTLKIQEELFKEELEKITTDYKKTIKQVGTDYELYITNMSKAYSKQMKEALAVMERQDSTITKQSEALEKYEKISANWQISLDEKQVTRLEDLFKQQRGELESLQQQLNSLERKL